MSSVVDLTTYNKLLSEKNKLTVSLKKLQQASNSALSEFGDLKQKYADLCDENDLIKDQLAHLSRDRDGMQAKLEQSGFLIKKLCKASKSAIAEFKDVKQRFLQEYERRYELEQMNLQLIRKLDMLNGAVAAGSGGATLEKSGTGSLDMLNTGSGSKKSSRDNLTSSVTDQSIPPAIKKSPSRDQLAASFAPPPLKSSSRDNVASMASGEKQSSIAALKPSSSRDNLASIAADKKVETTSNLSRSNSTEPLARKQSLMSAMARKIDVTPTEKELSQVKVQLQDTLKEFQKFKELTLTMQKELEDRISRDITALTSATLTRRKSNFPAISTPSTMTKATSPLSETTYNQIKDGVKLQKTETAVTTPKTNRHAGIYSKGGFGELGAILSKNSTTSSEDFPLKLLKSTSSELLATTSKHYDTTADSSSTATPSKHHQSQLNEIASGSTTFYDSDKESAEIETLARRLRETSQETKSIIEKRSSRVLEAARQIPSGSEYSSPRSGHNSHFRNSMKQEGGASSDRASIYTIVSEKSPASYGGGKPGLISNVGNDRYRPNSSGHQSATPTLFNQDQSVSRQSTATISPMGSYDDDDSKTIVSSTTLQPSRSVQDIETLFDELESELGVRL